MACYHLAPTLKPILAEMENAIVILSVIVGSAICIGLAILVLRAVYWILGRRLGPKLTPEQRREQERRYQQRLLEPQWDELEAHFGFDVRPALESLYTDHELLHRERFYFVPSEPAYPDEDHFIARFEPADAQTMKDVWFEIGENRFPFASDDFGNYFCVEISPGAQDFPVLYADHDDVEGSDASTVASSLVEFLQWETREEGTRAK
jgi:hypothetical protein